MKKLCGPICVLLIMCLSFALCSCAKQPNEPSSEDESGLYDKNGLYIEENFVLAAAAEKENGIELFADNATDYRIVYRATDDAAINTAISELKTALLKYCASVSVVTDESAPIEHEIVIGATNREFALRSPLQKVGAYVVATVGEKLFIYAENTYGITNGIYGFMEDYLGCMFFDSTTTHYAALTKLVLPQLYDEQTPAFDHRELCDRDAWTSLFGQKLRVRSDEVFDEDTCHTTSWLLNDKRITVDPSRLATVKSAMNKVLAEAQSLQLCFSNPDVIDVLEEFVMERIDNYEEREGLTFWWDISQADSMVYCECDECMRLAAEHGGNPAAALYLCVNEIARRHPELHFSTLAYQYGSTPPTGIEFPDNVMIKWCVMAAYGRNDFGAPLSEKKSAVAEQEYNELVGWSKLTDKIYVWDYITNYFYYMIPFPCLDAMAGNIKLYKESSVQGVFVEAAPNSRAAWDRIKANLAAHLLWNPDIDYKQFIGKFMTLYYGKEAALHILNIYNRMQTIVADPSVGPLCIYDFPNVHERDYLSEENMTYYFAELEQAFAKTTDEAVLARLRYEKATLLYPAIDREYFTAEWRAAAKEEFYDICQEFGITHLDELNTRSVADFVGK